MVKKCLKEILKKEEVNGEKLLSPKYDVVFHALFRKGNENITKALIQDITQREYKIIDMDKNVIIVNDNIKKKNEILDLKVELDNGEICNIEIQLINKKNFKERMLEYWAKLYSNQLDKGEDYIELKRTILIAIVDFNIKEFIDEGYHTIWRIREDKNTKLILTNNFELHIIEMKKARGRLGNDKSDKVAQWMTFFDNPNSMEVKNMSEKNQDINEALEQLRKLSANKQLREMLDREERYERDRRAEIQYAKEEAQEEGYAEGHAKGHVEGRAEGREEGIAEGKKEGKAENRKEVTIEMLKKHLPIKLISEITQLTKEEIIEIKKQID